jgi:hypothetical protein
MAASAINIATAGALKNGQRIFSFDFGTNNRWDFALCKINGNIMLFGSHNSGTQGQWVQINKTTVAGNWADSELSDYRATLAKYAHDSALNPAAAYVTDTTEIGLYIDAKGNITNAPATDQTTEEKIAKILTGNTAGTQTATEEKKWYQKPITYIIGVGILAVVGFFAFKK